MCGGVLDCHCDTTRSRRSDFGKIRVKCQCEGRLLVGSSVGLSSRSKLRYLPFDQSQEPGVANSRNH
jgi:hypothetical protein